MTPRLNDVRRVPAPAPAPESSENEALMAGAAADSDAGGAGGGAEVDVSGTDDAAGNLYTDAERQEADPAGDFLADASNDSRDHDAVSQMMDSENASHSTLEAFEEADREESIDLDTGESPDSRPPGVALADLVRKIRQRTDDTPPPPEPSPEPKPQGDPGDPDADADGDFDDDGTPNHLDPDYEPPPAPEDTPAPTRGPVDLSNIPPSQPSQQLADIGQESPVNPQEMIDPRFRSSAVKNDLSLPTGESPYRRRGGRGKREARARLRLNGDRGWGKR